MKNLYKKIGVVVLSGMLLSGVCLSSGLSVYANKISEKDMKKYEQNIYGPQLPESNEYSSPLVGLLGNDEDPRVKKLIQEIEKVCNGKIFKPIQLSSEYGEIDGQKLGIPGFLDGLQEILNKYDGGKILLSGPQLFFDDIDDFKNYIEKYSPLVESGIVRIQIGGVDGIFRARSGKAE